MLWLFFGSDDGGRGLNFHIKPPKYKMGIRYNMNIYINVLTERILETPKIPFVMHTRKYTKYRNHKTFGNYRKCRSYRKCWKHR